MNKQEIKKQILQKEFQIKKLMQNSDATEFHDSLINSLILEKAILIKDLKDSEKNPFVESVKRILPHKEKRICDYFKTV